MRLRACIPGLDEGTDGVDGEEHDGGEGEKEEQVEAWVSQLGTDGLDADVGDGSRRLYLLLPQALLQS